MALLSALIHETGRSSSRVPSESRSSARNARLSPTARSALAGTTVTLATGAAEPATWTVCESLRPPLVAVMVTMPCFRPMTLAVSPTPVTLAVVSSLLVHDTDGLRTGLPFASPTAANRVIVPPTPT